MLKSIELVSQLRVSANIRNNLTELQDTTGAKVSGSPSSRSPRTQYRALYLLISPSGVRLRLKTQVPGKIRDFALAVSVSVHVSFFSKLAISAAAAAIHLSRLIVSDIASSYVSVSGSDGDTFKASGGEGRPNSAKIQALGSM